TDPGIGAFDLAFEREAFHARDRLVVAFIIFGLGALRPLTGGFQQSLEIEIESAAWNFTRAFCIFVAEHVKRDHHLAVAGMAGLVPSLPVAIDQRPDRADRDRHQAVTL